MSEQEASAGGSRFFEDYRIGEKVRSGERRISAKERESYLSIAGINSPLYRDSYHAREHGHRDRVVPELLVLSVVQSLLEQESLMGGSTTLVGIDDLLFTHPVHDNDSIHAELRIEELKLTSDPARGMVAVSAAVLNQHGRQVVRATIKLLVAVRNRRLEHTN